MAKLSKYRRNLNARIRYANSRGADIPRVTASSTPAEVRKISARQKKFVARGGLSERAKISNLVKGFNSDKEDSLDRIYIARSLEFSKKSELEGLARKVYGIILDDVSIKKEIVKNAKIPHRRLKARTLSSYLEKDLGQDLNPADTQLLLNALKAAAKSGNEELFNNLKKDGAQYAKDLLDSGFAINETYLVDDEEDGRIFSIPHHTKFDKMSLSELLSYKLKKKEIKDMTVKFPSIKEAKTRAKFNREREKIYKELRAKEREALSKI